jgi:hypothetical protein
MVAGGRERMVEPVPGPREGDPVPVDTVAVVPPCVFDGGLPFLGYLDPAYQNDPHTQNRLARERGPIAMGPLGPEVLAYDLAQTVLRDPRFAGQYGRDELGIIAPVRAVHHIGSVAAGRSKFTPVRPSGNHGHLRSSRRASRISAGRGQHRRAEAPSVEGMLRGLSGDAQGAAPEFGWDRR